MKTLGVWPPPRENTDRMCQNFPSFCLSDLHCFALVLISSRLPRYQTVSLLGFVAPLLFSHLKLSQNHFGIEWNIEIIPAGRWYHLSSLILDWIGMYNLLGIKTSKTVKSEWLAFSGAETSRGTIPDTKHHTNVPSRSPPNQISVLAAPNGGGRRYREDCGQS